MKTLCAMLVIMVLCAAVGVGGQDADAAGCCGAGCSAEKTTEETSDPVAPAEE